MAALSMQNAIFNAAFVIVAPEWRGAAQKMRNLPLQSVIEETVC